MTKSDIINFVLERKKFNLNKNEAIYEEEVNKIYQKVKEEDVEVRYAISKLKEVKDSVKALKEYRNRYLIKFSYWDYGNIVDLTDTNFSEVEKQIISCKAFEYYEEELVNLKEDRDKCKRNIKSSYNMVIAKLNKMSSVKNMLQLLDKLGFETDKIKPSLDKENLKLFV